MEFSERRLSARPPNPACLRCEAPGVSVALRTAFVLYYRCAVCGEIWSVPKPDHAIPAAVRLAERFS